MILELNGRKPIISAGTFVADDADIIGNAVIGECASIWFKAVIRADVNCVRIGQYTNVQDSTVIHVTKKFPAEIGDYVTIGHRALIHACRIGNNCLIGMGAIIMDGAEIGDNSIVGAGSLVTQGTTVPVGSLVIGSPARIKRMLTPEEVEMIKKSAEDYYGYAERYKKTL